MCIIFCVVLIDLLPLIKQFPQFIYRTSPSHFLIYFLALPTLIAFPRPAAVDWQVGGAVVQGRRGENLKITTMGNNNKTQN